MESQREGRGERKRKLDNGFLSARPVLEHQRDETGRKDKRRKEERLTTKNALCANWLTPNEHIQLQPWQQDASIKYDNSELCGTVLSRAEFELIIGDR